MTPDDDITRRTRLAAERTWLAWWRSGIATTTAAVAVGGVVPELLDGDPWPYLLLGAGYALVAAAIFLGGALRQHRVRGALDRGEYEGVETAWVLGLTIAGAVLALGTLAVILAQP